MAESSEVGAGVEGGSAGNCGAGAGWLAGWRLVVAEDKAGRRLLRGLGQGWLASFDWLAARAECWEIKKYSLSAVL
jgi:hypothetical protein